MKIKTGVLIKLALLLVVTSVSTSKVALAQEPVSLGIFPPILEVVIEPDSQITQVFKIYNQGQEPLVLETKLVAFKPKGETGEITLEETISEAEKSWFSFLNKNLALGDRFNLPAGQSQEVVLVINIPASHTDSEGYYTLLVQTVPDERITDTLRIGGQIKVGSHILLSISKQQKREQNISIDSFKIENLLLELFNLKIIDSFTPPAFTVKLKNDGKHFTKSTGQITVTDLFGQKQVLNLSEENILAASIRQINCAEGEGEKLTPATCTAAGKFFVGSYQVSLKTANQEQNLTFISLPIKLMTGLAVIGVFLLIVKRAAKFRLDN